MKKIIYPLLIILISCGGEEKPKNGKVVHKKDDEVQNIDSVKEIKNDDSALVEVTKDSDIKLPNGATLKYLKKGSGATLKKGDLVRMKYKTYLPSGKLVDGSDLIKKDITLLYYIGINMSVKGWDEVFQYLKIGDKIKLHLPSEEAYGKKGFGAMVPPDTDLDFEIEITERAEMKVTESGLRYAFLLRNEDGRKAVDGKKADIHYYGWTYKDGKMFDSSHSSGNTYRFIIGGGEEIQAWEEVVKLMNKGDKVIMFVPSKLGYAEKGVPEMVEPNADLVYIFELMNVI